MNNSLDRSVRELEAAMAASVRELEATVASLPRSISSRAFTYVVPERSIRSVDEKAEEVSGSSGPRAAWARVARHQRQLRFILVGGVCFTIQYLILEGLTKAGVGATTADASGFAVSAQLNFMLSSLFTWSDRKSSNRRSWLYRLAGYNVTAAVSLLLNAGAFDLVHRHLGNLVGAAAGVLCGMGFTYVLCNFAIFRGTIRSRQTAQVPAMADLEGRQL